MFPSVPWQDFVLVFGGLVGLYSNAYALYDSDTTWSRKSSVPKAVTLTGTATAFWTLGLPMSATVTTLNTLVWVGIAIWRVPDEEDQ